MPATFSSDACGADTAKWIDNQTAFATKSADELLHRRDWLRVGVLAEDRVFHVVVDLGAEPVQAAAVVERHQHPVARLPEHHHRIGSDDQWTAGRAIPLVPVVLLVRNVVLAKNELVVVVVAV